MGLDKTRKKTPLDGWKVERTFAWLGNFRRLLVVRYEHCLSTFRAFFLIAFTLGSLKRPP